MSIQRMSRIMRMLALLAALALGLVALGLVVTAQPAHASGVAIENNEQVVEFGHGVSIGRGLDVKGAVAFGGNIDVAGTVQDSVVAFGGDITVSGTVKKSVVALGGDVHLLPTAVVGGSMKSSDTSVVSVGGTVTRDAGAQVTGQTKAVSRSSWASAASALGNSGLNGSQWFGWSLVGWIVQTAIALVLALVAVALMPKQMLAVQGVLARRPGASLGWGALTFFVIVPVTFIVLIVSIVGILLAIPLLVFVLLAYFFVATGVAAFVVQRLLAAGGGKQRSLMLAVVIGVVATTLISRVPVAGGLAVLVMLVFGVGAGVLSFFEWRQGRRPVAAPAAPQTGPGGYPGAPGGPVGGPAADPAGRGLSGEAGSISATPAAAVAQTYAPSAAPIATQAATEPATLAQPAPAEAATLAQPAPFEAPQAPSAPAAPDASRLPAQSSHVVPGPGAAQGSPGQE